MFATKEIDGFICVKSKDIPYIIRTITIHDINNILSRHSDKVSRVKIEGVRDNFITLDGLNYIINKYKKKIIKSEYNKVIDFIYSQKNKEKEIKQVKFEKEQLINEIDDDIFVSDTLPEDRLQYTIFKAIEAFRSEFKGSNIKSLEIEINDLKQENLNLIEQNNTLKEKLKTIEDGLKNLF